MAEETNTTTLAPEKLQELRDKGVPESMIAAFSPADTTAENNNGGDKELDAFIDNNKKLNNENNGGGDNIIIDDKSKPEANKPEVNSTDTTDDNENEEVSLFEVLNKDNGTDFKQDEQKDIYANLKDYVEHLSNTKSEKKYTEKINSNPLLKLVDEGYSEQVVDLASVKNNYEALELKEGETDDTVLEETFRTYLSSKGLDKEDIEEAITNAKINDKLFDKAKKGREEIIKALDIDIENQKKIEDKAKVDAETNYTKVINTLKEEVKKGFNSIVLEEKEIESFTNKITTIVDKKKGLTQADIDFYNLSDTDKMTIDWLVDKKLLGEVHKLLSNQSSSTGATKIKELARANDGRIKINATSSSKDKTPTKEIGSTKELMEYLKSKKS